jgi:hypothetical protein
LKPEVTRAVEVAAASVESDRAVIAAARARRRASLARLDERAHVVVVMELLRRHARLDGLALLGVRGAHLLRLTRAHLGRLDLQPSAGVPGPIARVRALRDDAPSGRNQLSKF